MTEAEHLQAAIDERDIAAKELVKMARHVMLCNDVIDRARIRLEKFTPFMSIEEHQESGEAGSKTLVA